MCQGNCRDGFLRLCHGRALHRRAEGGDALYGGGKWYTADVSPSEDKENVVTAKQGIVRYFSWDVKDVPLLTGNVALRVIARDVPHRVAFGRRAGISSTVVPIVLKNNAPEVTPLYPRAGEIGVSPYIHVHLLIMEPEDMLDFGTLNLSLTVGGGNVTLIKSGENMVGGALTMSPSSNSNVTVIDYDYTGDGHSEGFPKSSEDTSDSTVTVDVSINDTAIRPSHMHTSYSFSITNGVDTDGDSLPDDWEWAVFAGTEEVLWLLRDKPVDVWILQEGTVFLPEMPVMVILGDYIEYAELETAILGLLIFRSHSALIPHIQLQLDSILDTTIMTETTHIFHITEMRTQEEKSFLI